MSYETAPPKTKYLPFNRFHQAPVTKVSPKAIITSAKDMLRVRHLKDRENIKLETVQNNICKSLGFLGGFAGFREEYRKALNPFMEENGLVTPADLVTPVDAVINGGTGALVRFSHRQLADRFFQDDLPMPNRVFTGIGVSLLGFLQFAWNLDGYLVTHLWDDDTSEPDGKIPEGGYVVSRSNATLSLEHISVLSNMLGDQCLDYGFSDHPVSVVLKIYFSKDMEDAATEKDQYDKAGLLFRSLLMELPNGWLDVVPYNKNLVFLRGQDGRYDFVFRNMRDTPFQHNPYAPYLKNADVPITGSRYDFNRWLYFPSSGERDCRSPYNGWQERDEHAAEKAFYAVGGSARSHPGDDLLCQYLIAKGEYLPLSDSAFQSDGFHECRIDDERYYVSNLITIGQFRAFMEGNHGYRDYSRSSGGVDDWQTVNTDNEQLPATATWYDAMAYATWVSKRDKLPVRLLTEHEFRAISSPLIPSGGMAYFEEFIDNPSIATKGDAVLTEKYTQALRARLCRFERPDGASYPDHPPYMCPVEFDRLIVKFDPEAITWVESEEGLRFLRSPYFGEWLQPEGAAVNCYLLGSMVSMPGGMASAGRVRFSPMSTGKYKSFKIGFRLIYKAS